MPPRVDYSLTPLGESLAEPLAALGEWAYQHIPEVNAAIAAYDRAPETETFWILGSGIGIGISEQW